MGLFSKDEPQPRTVAGVELRCEVCKFEKFHYREATMHGAAASFFDVEWLSPSADCYVCGKCGYVHWFLPV